MKKKNILITLLALLLMCSACGSNPQPEPEPQEVTPENAMDNFVKKLEAGNYVIDAKNYVKTTAVSPEQVYFIHEGDPDAFNYALFTLNGETFEAEFEEEGMSDVTFISKGTAIEAMTFMLPNYWIELSEGNMWNLFYNNVDDPLEFTTNDVNVKTTLLALGGYGQLALDQTEEVHVKLDDVDPTSVRFTAVVNDIPAARIYYDDLDLTMEFGKGTSEPRIEKWLKDPVYPPTKSGWDWRDEATMDNVFMRDYGTAAVPFPKFASYALIFDDDAYMDRTEILVTDAHGTEEDVKNYIDELKKIGYKEVQKDGQTVYRKLLREEYRAYAELEVYYDNGFVLVGRAYHDNPTYDGLQAISAAVEEKGFAPLADTDLLKGWSAADTSASRSEGWAYFFDYDFYLDVILDYEDEEAVKTYLEDYGKTLLTKGFDEEFTPNDSIGKYATANGYTEFKYEFGDEGQVLLSFKVEKTLTPEEANRLITEHGIPDPELFGEIGTRDTTRYYYQIAQFTGLHLMVYQHFDAAAEAEQYLDKYAAVLDEEGYLPTDPQSFNCYKTFLFFNEEARKYVAFDYLPGEDGADVNFEFVSIETETEDTLQSFLKR